MRSLPLFLKCAQRSRCDRGSRGLPCARLSQESIAEEVTEKGGQRAAAARRGQAARPAHQATVATGDRLPATCAAAWSSPCAKATSYSPLRIGASQAAPPASPRVAVQTALDVPRSRRGDWAVSGGCATDMRLAHLPTQFSVVVPGGGCGGDRTKMWCDRRLDLMHTPAHAFQRMEHTQLVRALAQ